MVKVKICGLTTKKDIDIINKYRPDYIGFVFAESRRKVTPGIVREMTGALAAEIKKVGVFVNASAETVNEISDICEIDIIQLHGDETPYYCSLINKPIWKAVRVKDEKSLENVQQYPVDTLLLDAYAADQYGGVGRTFDWELVSKIGADRRIILAGGLNNGNVEAAISLVHPYCVDVSSGVETDGRKDEAKIKEFLEKVRFGGFEDE
ncbi:phosphoribosylanthranilate isomerase [Petroclostridium sp. X23]|jgi:phosphoribosylanthranilate isomerase|uniref:phosphoribosylanthranilate isomerase n=1 Tax=Petroclostridium sp. X23 TaxID=3045146 RepID=UPI0024ACEC3B|nr:phosphoribosylanthranilate isomerase [Petroclostridium sp. X23]WHH59598.1 phosphoribosylanthranilate isomerase [Petroclostridium sp. X23]